MPDVPEGVGSSTPSKGVCELDIFERRRRSPETIRVVGRGEGAGPTSSRARGYARLINTWENTFRALLCCPGHILIA